MENKRDCEEVSKGFGALTVCDAPGAPCATSRNSQRLDQKMNVLHESRLKEHSVDRNKGLKKWAARGASQDKSEDG